MVGLKCYPISVTGQQNHQIKKTVPVYNLTFLRSQNLLQPQPEFQKREQMKKRRQRRKSDISKMDLTELRRKLERKMVCNG